MEKLTPYYSKDELLQVVTDYISGMTDQFAIRRYLDLFIPNPLAEHTHDDAIFKKINNLPNKSPV